MDQTLRAYQACLDDTDVSQVSRKLKGSDLMTLKRILEKHRRVYKTTKVRALQLETSLVEKAADMGDSEAIVLLCYRALSAAPGKVSKEDVDHADRLLTALLTKNEPVAFKVCGDLAYQTGKLVEARKFYRLALTKGLGRLETCIESWRNIGHLSLGLMDKATAKTAFATAVLLANDLDLSERHQVSDCHYLLSQMVNDTDKQLYHLEEAARFGLKEALAPLGHFYWRIQGDLVLAREYFKLGAEIHDLPCLNGLKDLSPT